jgi:hypothetical protein
VSKSELHALLTRSQDFVEHLFGLLAQVQDWDGSPRAAACGLSAELSLEHGQAVAVLFATGLPNAACVTLRAQYEAVLRSAWLLYCANDDQVNRLLQPLTLEAEQGAKNLPGALQMLEALKKREQEVPGLKGLVAPLAVAHDVLWKALNSFAHAGIHALHRTDRGFPQGLVMDVVRNANALSHFAARLKVRTGLSVHLHHEVDRAWMGHQDCLPVVRQSSDGTD